MTFPVFSLHAIFQVHKVTCVEPIKFNTRTESTVHEKNRTHRPKGQVIQSQRPYPLGHGCPYLIDVKYTKDKIILNRHIKDVINNKIQFNCISFSANYSNHINNIHRKEILKFKKNIQVIHEQL